MSGLAYRRDIDGLRAVAVLPVILFHAGLTWFSGGYVGVDVFFVISGYLITSLILADLAQGRFSILRFYERRARRILPALLFVILCCLPLAWAGMRPVELEDFGQSLVATMAFASNILFLIETDYFAPSAEMKPLLHTWSLAVEEQFYVIVPLLLAALHALARRSAVWVIAALALISFALCEWGWRHAPSFTFYMLPMRAWELFAGSLCAFALAGRGVLRAGPAGEFAALAGLAAILWAVLFLDGDTPFPSAWALLPVLGTCLIILFAAPQTWAARILTLKPFVWVGLVSYSAYLWHQPLFAFARLRLEGHPPQSLMLGLAALALGLAWLSWRYVETPFRQGGGWLPRQAQVFAASLAMMTLIGGLGLAGHIWKGWPGRYMPEDQQLATLSPQRMGGYVIARFNALGHRPFPDNGKPNLLIIGDSYGQDLVNAIAEAGLAKRANLSTYHIPAFCGNLDLPQIPQDPIPERDRPLCAAHPRYDDPGLQQRLAQADAVIITASWRLWQAELITQSLARTETRTEAPVLVLGRKNFGRVNPHALLAIPAKDRPALRVRPTEAHLQTNASMAAAGMSGFIDLSALICGTEAQCPLFDDAGRLLSHDGGHLTPEGAALVGQRLYDEVPAFRAIFGPESSG